MSSRIKPVLSSAWKVISWPLFGQSRKVNAFWAFLMAVALLTNVYAFKIGGTGWDMFWVVVSAMILGTEINNFIYNRRVEPDSTWYTKNATLRAERDAWTKIDVARDVDFATLRASEAAALARVKVLTEALAKAQYGLSWAKANLRDFNVQGAPVNDGLIATGRALTPTADKE